MLDRGPDRTSRNATPADAGASRTAPPPAARAAAGRLLESLPEMVWQLSADLRYTGVNPAVEALLGYRPAEVVGRPFHDLLTPLSGEPLRRLAAQPRDGRRLPAGFGRGRVELEHRRRDGTPLWTEVVAAPLWDRRGRLLGYGGITREITGHRQAEAALVHSRNLIAYLIQHDRSAIAVHDRELRYLYVSRRYLEDYRLTETDIIGRHHYEVFPEIPERWREVHRRALAGEVLSCDEERFERQDGSVDWVRWECRPWYEADGAIGGIVLNTEVITEAKEAEAERQRLQAQLAQAQRMESIGRLAGGVAHDFNNMLGVILGHADLALGQNGLSPRLEAHLQGILKAAERSAELTQQLLAFARKQIISPRVLDLNDAVEGLLKMLRRLIGEHIELLWQPGPGHWPVLADPTQLHQVLANLCVNARDAITGVGRVTLATEEVTVTAADRAGQPGLRPGDYVRITVSDTGRGMDRETRERLFEPFFTTKAVGEGTGLGLAIVYGIVKQNQGFIYVESEPGRGASFRIYWPRHLGETPADAEAAREPAPRGHETILVVEDNPEMLQMTTQLLRRQGYTVLTAARPGEALRLAREHRNGIDLLITDVVMPEMNGRDLARKLMAAHPRLKRLYMSGYTADVIAQHGVLEPGVHFLQKPFSIRHIAHKVREVLAAP